MVENVQRLPRVDTLMKLATVLEIGVEGIEWIPPAPSPNAARRIDPADVEDFLARHRDEAA